MADRHLVEIFAGGLYLTGFLIGPRLVLTAGHGLVDGDGAPMIRRLSDVDGFECAVLWRGAPADLALLEVTDSRWRPGAGLTPVTWGRLPEPTAIHEGRVAVLCAARGFPVAQRRPDGVRVVETMWGRVHVGTGELSGMFQIHVTSGELEPVRGGSGWRGMSGGAVFADDMLIGVLVEDMPHVRARLSAVPATALLDDPAAVRILASCGVATAADPVRIRPARRERTNIQIGLVPNKAAFFQQRPEAARLDRALHGGGAVVLTQVIAGMGGIGKTQLAADHAARAWEERRHDVVVWVSAASPATVPVAYAEAARRLGIAAGAEGELAAVAFVNWLKETRRSWLIVLDDVTDANAVTRWLPAPGSGDGHVLITTRLRDAAIQAVGEVVPVGVFSPEQSATYLTGALRRPVDVRDLAGLAEDLGHLPIALAQAAAYIVNKQITCAEYRRRLRDRERLLPVPEASSLPDGHRHAAGATLRLSVEAADGRRPSGLAGTIIGLAAVLDPDGIPRELFTSGPALRFLGIADDDGADLVADALANLHLLHAIDLTPERVRIHAVVQRATTDLLDPAALAEAVAAAADGLMAIWPEVERDPARSQMLRSNATALREHHPGPLWTSGAHPVLLREARSLGEWGLFSTALEHFGALHEEAVRRGGEDRADVLRLRGELAFWRGRAGNVPGAWRPPPSCSPTSSACSGPTTPKHCPHATTSPGGAGTAAIRKPRWPDMVTCSPTGCECSARTTGTP